MSIPARMTAIAIREPGPPNVLVPQEREMPQPKAGEMLVKVAAAGINRPDVMQREGKYPPPPGAPDIPGLELAGEVVALGGGVTRWKSGDKVTALVPGGGGYLPSRCITSGRLMPAAATFTSISPAFGCGVSRSCGTSTSGGPGSRIAMAVMRAGILMSDPRIGAG